jgi:hypothetical protein
MKYQWVKGDNQGAVEEVRSSDKEWIDFTSGRRISQELVNEYMIPITHDSQIIDTPSGVTATSNSSYSFTQESTEEVIRDSEGNTYSVPKPSKNTPRKNIVNNHGLQEPGQNVHQKQEPESPIKLLIKKSLKDKVEVSYNFEIDLPKSSVYGIIQESFDIDLDDEILSEVMSKINMNDMKKSIEEAIKNQIMLHYNK